jgi:vancomycin resistance protein YoaR
MPLRVALALPLLAAFPLLAWLLRIPSQEREMAAFATGLRGRAQSQIHNVRLALSALDGQVIAPGRDFSFCQAVGPWTRDRGYRKAPVSYSGDLTLDWGGGVCQASTTLYNAALLAALPILERHRHYWPATYVPPGQDAAVAYPNIDLRLRNDLRFPVRIRARVEGESAVVRLYSRSRPPAVSLDRKVLAVTAPTTVVRSRSAGARRGVHLGQPGYQVALYRVFAGTHSRRELISLDTYPPQNRVIWQ